MFGIEFIKFEPGIYALYYRMGKLVKEGEGLSFFYFSPISSIAAIAVTSSELSFIFEDITSDYQFVTVQGNAVYRIKNPRLTAKMLNFTLDTSGKKYISDDNEKLPDRILKIVQVITKNELSKINLKGAIISSSILAEEIFKKISKNNEIESLGIEMLGISLLAVSPNKETSRALESKTREEILKEADDAIYLRRNFSIEQERIIKENELNTQILIENKKRQIKEAQMEAERSIQEKQYVLKEEEMKFKIALEEEKSKLVEMKTQNDKLEADAKAYGISVSMQAIQATDPMVIQALAGSGMKSDQLIASAFQTLASKAEKIANLNISPDLLQELIQK